VAVALWRQDRQGTLNNDVRLFHVVGRVGFDGADLTVHSRGVVRPG
jgi:hypothetical protein